MRALITLVSFCLYVSFDVPTEAGVRKGLRVYKYMLKVLSSTEDNGSERVKFTNFFGLKLFDGSVRNCLIRRVSSAI